MEWVSDCAFDGACSGRLGISPWEEIIGILLEAIDGIIDPAATLSQWAAIIVTSRCTDSHRQSWGPGRHWKASLTRP